MSSASEVEMVFSIESGTGGLDADLIRLRGVNNRVELFRELTDTSLQFFIELDNRNGDAHRDSQVKIGLLKVGPDIYYPLNKSKTLIYLLDNGAYLFPPEENTFEPGCHLVINLGENLNPHTANAFREILSVYSSIVEEVYGNDPVIDRIIEYYRSPHPSKAETNSTPEMNGSEAFALGMVKTAEVLAAGLGWATEQASGLIHHGGSKLRGMNFPQRRANVDPNVITALRAAKVASGCTKNLVESASYAVQSGTQRLGQTIAPVFVDRGSRLMSNVTGMDNSSSENVMNGIVTVGSGGIQAIGVLAGSVTDSVINLGRAVAEETVGIVNKAFGSPAAQATSDAFETAGNVARSYRNIRDIRPKNILKKTAINTAIATAQMNGASSRDDQEEENRRDYTYPKYPHYPPYPSDPRNEKRGPQ